jgi:uracil-DNA glycosylase
MSSDSHKAMLVAIKPEWKKVLAGFFETSTFKSLTEFVQQEYITKSIYPKETDLFKAFSLTPFSQVKVVILGQDPYHGEGQAHGLSFSVPLGTTVPPSLKNIYKEIEGDVGIKKDFANGNLESWATQGVLLINSVLSVIANTPASHKGKGWEEFTDTVIQAVSDKHEHVVFMLWGNFAKSKKHLIDTSKHLVVEAAHPSPFSAHTGFFGSQHFSKCNNYLKKYGKTEIRW